MVGYQLNFIINSITATPAIEYSFESSGDSVKSVRCEITNLASNKSVADLEFSFKYQDEPIHDIYNPSIKEIPPSSPHIEKPKSTLDEIVVFDIHQIQPGLSYILKFNLNAGNKAFEYPDVYLTTNTTVRLMPRSLTTIIVKHQLLLNVLLLAIWIIILITYLIYYNYKTTKK